MARGVEGRQIFLDDNDRSGFLANISRLREELRYSILAYCLMDNHFHFAIKVEEVPLQTIMHRLLTAHAVAFNERYDRNGHLFQGRYKAVLCLNDGYLIALIRYIHMNPVRAGLVMRADQWRWSSHRAYRERASTALIDTRLVLNALHGEPVDPDCSAQPDEPFNPWPILESPSPLLRSKVGDSCSIEEIAAVLFQDAQSRIEVRSESRRRETVRKRVLLAQECLKKGHSLLSIARWLGRTPPAIHHLLRRKQVN
jgi:REP element-mobilizing transposase RayT